MASIPWGLLGLMRLRRLEYHWQALIVVVVGAFMAMLDTTVVNIALPRIIAVFGAPVHEAQFVLTGYLLAMAIGMPATGYLVDTFGSKRIYMLSIVFFALGSLLCAAAWDVPSLVLFRVMQGLGGGILLPLGMTIIFKAAPVDRRGTVMSVFGLPLVLAPIVGPTLGGYLVEFVDWRMIFLLNLPVGVLGVLLVSALLRDTERRSDLRFDLRGFVLSAVGFAALLYGLANAPSDGWTAPHIVALLGLGLGASLLWVWVELVDKSPLLDLRVFRSPVYTLAVTITFVAVAMFSTIFLVPLFLQGLRGLGPLETGLLVMPQALAAGLTMPLAGRLFDRFGARPLVVGGLLLLAFAAWQLHYIDLATSRTTLWLLFAAQGVAMGFINMPVMTVALASLPGPLVARGTSLTSVLRQLFAAFGTAVFATLLQVRQSFYLESLAPGDAAGVATASVAAFQDCFLIASGLALVGLVPALFLRGGRQQTSRPQGPPT